MKKKKTVKIVWGIVSILVVLSMVASSLVYIFY